MKTVKSQKKYKCYICGKTIPKDRKHLLESFKDDSGEWTNRRKHRHCA